MSNNLYQAPNGTFYARLQVNGRDIRKSLRTADRRVARQRLKDLLEEAENQRAGVKAPERHLWGEAVERWIDLQFEDLRPGTQVRYRTSLRQLHPFFGARDIAGITAADVHEYVTARRRKKVSGATIRRDLMVMGRVMRVARRAGWISQSPVPDEMVEIKERRESIRPVSTRLLGKLVRRAPPGFRDLIRFLARTGCRQEEAASLEWSQLSLRGTPATCTFTRTKTRSPRVIELAPQVVRDLLRLPRPSEEHVFCSRDGGRYQNVPGQFRRLVRLAIGAAVPPAGRGRPATPATTKAIPFRCHDLRHTYAIRALQRGVPIYDVARHLGHSSVKTTEIYAAWLSKAAR